MTKFILEMDKYFYCLCLDESGNWCNFIKQKCHGNIEDRPKWCPLVEEKENMITITTLEERLKRIEERIDWLMSLQEDDRAITINEANEVVSDGKSLKIGLEEWVK
jgi:hypothetical protein